VIADQIDSLLEESVKTLKGISDKDLSWNRIRELNITPAQSR
jgi:hypothetical protein